HSGLVGHLQTERFPDLETLRAPLRLLAQRLRRPVAEAVALLLPPLPLDAAEMHEALWRPLLEPIEIALQRPWTLPADHVDDDAHRRLVHDVEQLLDGSIRPACGDDGIE